MNCEHECGDCAQDVVAFGIVTAARDIVHEAEQVLLKLYPRPNGEDMLNHAVMFNLRAAQLVLSAMAKDVAPKEHLSEDKVFAGDAAPKQEQHRGVAEGIGMEYTSDDQSPPHLAGAKRP